MTTRNPPLPKAIARPIAAICARLAARARVAKPLPMPAFSPPPDAIVATVIVRTINPLNRREHYRARAKRVARERLLTIAAMRALRCDPPPLPVVVTLTRIGPRTMDSDGAIAALKSVRDEVAAWLRVDDRDTDQLVWRYGTQQRGPYAVRVVVERTKEPT